MKEGCPIYLLVRAHSPLSRTFHCNKLFFVPFKQLHVLLPSTYSWFLLILGWWVGVLWGCKLKFLLNCICPLMAWWRVVLLCYTSHLDDKGRNFIGTFIKALSQCLRDVVLHPWSWPYETPSIDLYDWWHLLIKGCILWSRGISLSWA